MRTVEEILSAAEKADAFREKHKGKSDAPDFDPKLGRTHGVTGRSAFFDLSYFNPITQCPLDMMHLMSGVTGRHLVPLMTKNRLQRVVAQGKAHDKARKNMTPAERAAAEDAPRWRQAEKEKNEQDKDRKAKHLQFKRDKAIFNAKGEKKTKLQEAERKRNQKAAKLLKQKQVISENRLGVDVLRSDHDRPADEVRQSHSSQFARRARAHFTVSCSLCLLRRLFAT